MSETIENASRVWRRPDGTPVPAYRVWLRPDGAVSREDMDGAIISDGVLYSAFEGRAEIDSEELDLPNGVMVYDTESEGEINMAAMGIAKGQGVAIRGNVVFAVRGEDGKLRTAMDSNTANWIGIFASGRCTVCGVGNKTLVGDAFPISRGRCCDKCEAVVKSVRSYMGISKWRPRSAK